MALAPSTETQVTSADRLGFTLFMAVAVHAIVLLGVGFSEERPPALAHTLEVTLAQFESDKAPDQADFIAQKNQQGSGESEQKSRPTTTERALFQSNEAQQVAADNPPLPVPENQPRPMPAPKKTPPAPEPKPEPAPKSAPKEKPEVLVTEARKAPRKEPRAEKKAAASPSESTPGTTSSLLARSLEIASLEAKLDLQRQALAKRPRIRTLYSASTRESYDAAYLEGWRRKVERIGNLNYPEEAHRRGLYGYLRLLVVIEPDGSVKRVEILQSSGHSVLDDAAKRIVHMAAPYAAFPPEIRKRADLVEIIRTWRFERSRVGIRSG